ncbi:hypothetical protein YC2023_036542 [Brassica napus]
MNDETRNRKRVKAHRTYYKRPKRRAQKNQITNRAQGPPTIPNDPEGTPPSRGQTLRLRRRPPSKRHRVKPTVDSPEGTGNYSLNTITTANAFHSGESKLGERQSRTDDDRAEETSTSRGQEPASTELKKPPPPGEQTQETSPRLTTTAPLRQRQICHGRLCSRAQARRLEEKTKPR